MSLLQRFNVVVTLVVAAGVTSIVSDGRAPLPRIAIPIPPATELRIVWAVCHEGSVRVTPVPDFAGAAPTKTDINQACVRDWNDSLYALITRASVPVDPDAR